nr:PGPGW domain-containing protein [uncultured Desulfobulbus sp.]
MLEILGLFSLCTFVLSILAVPWIIGRLPVDYFVSNWQRSTQQPRQHLGMGLLRLVLRNIVGVLLLLAGFVMLFLPGQGILTMIIGLCLIDFPGKRQLLQGIVSRVTVQQGLNWVRRKKGKAAFEFF